MEDAAEVSQNFSGRLLLWLKVEPYLSRNASITSSATTSTTPTTTTAGAEASETRRQS